jgi:hypothetical protein
MEGSHRLRGLNGEVALPRVRKESCGQHDARDTPLRLLGDGTSEDTRVGVEDEGYVGQIAVDEGVDDVVDVRLHTDGRRK